MITDDQVKEYAKEWEFYKEAHSGFVHYLVYLLKLSKAKNQKLQKENEELKNKLDRFITMSNDLSVYFRGTWRPGDMKERIEKMYNFQCECEEFLSNL